MSLTSLSSSSPGHPTNLLASSRLYICIPGLLSQGAPIGPPPVLQGGIAESRRQPPSTESEHSAVPSSALGFLSDQSLP